MAIPIRVLIVDDSEADAILVAIELRFAGYDVSYHRVYTPADMTAELRDHRWDVVISDHSMPQFTGFEALKLLQETGLHIPFILVSGSTDEDVATKAKNAGAWDYISKDSLARLVPTIQEILAEVGRDESKG